MCLCPTLQHEFCNITSGPYAHLFPNNNDTLQVDIYKGVCAICTSDLVSAVSLQKEKQHMDSQMNLELYFAVNSNEIINVLNLQ